MDLHQRTTLDAAAFYQDLGEITMRILFVIDGLPGGGREKVALTLASIFCAVGNGLTSFPARRLRLSAAGRAGLSGHRRPQPDNRGAKSPNFRAAPASWMPLSSLFRTAG